MRVVLCTCPPDRAEALARALVERGAACVNVLPAIRSFYTWNGSIQDDTESLLLIKASKDRVAALEQAIGELHPYELPEWVVLEPDALLTSPKYAAWVRGGG